VNFIQINNYLKENRHLLLLTLNILLVVFIVLEFFILTTINPDIGQVQAGSKRQLSSVGYHSN